jgi:phosphate transport system substrate-binding protein
MRRSIQLSIGVLVILSLILAACTSATPTPAPQEQPQSNPAPTATNAPAAEAPAASMPSTGNTIELPIVNPAEVTGSLYVAGSSTVFPVTEAIAELFRLDGYTGEIKVDSIGSGAGFERFCKNGETDISNASRPIKDSEVESCRALSPAREPIEFRVGTDALAIVISSQNDFLTDVTMEELALIFSDKATTWSDVNPAWPNENIQRFIPGTDSGTFDFFVEEVMYPAYNKESEVARRATLNAANLQQSEDDNVLVQGVEGNRFAIGYFGFAYYAENRSRLNVLSIESVMPDENTTEDGSYKLARPLFIYSDAGIMQSKPQVAAFINFYLSNVNEIITEVGYFPASEAALNAAKQAWLDAMSGETAAPAPTSNMIELPFVNPAEVTGSLYVAGSSTVFPVTEAIAELFRLDGYTGEIKVDSIGSGAGFERFCKNGETDISNASRPIRDSEVESCRALSPAREPIEFRVGTDALAIVISSQNDFLTDVTMQELALIFSDKATTWSDVNPAWPSEPIQRFIPGTDSGTYDFFIEEVMTPAFDKDAEAAERSALNAANLQQSEDDNVLVQGVEGNRFAIGYFGFAYYAENRSRLNVLSIESVMPDENTTEDGSYKLARPLFIYSDAGIMQSKPQVAAFINFYLSNVNEIITEVGYFPASEAALNAAKQAWLDAMK